MKTSKPKFTRELNNQDDNGVFPKEKSASSSKDSVENLDKNIKKVLLMGYNGANNTGSETRLISIIEDVKKVLGPEVSITIPTLNEKNLRRYVEENSKLFIAPIPSIYFFAIKKLVKEHDLVMLVEGSCYMDTWTSALLWAFLWTTRCANYYKVPCIAYAVDAGDLSRLNQFLVRKEASKTDLIITRTSYAAEKLYKIGVKSPLKHTADSAFTFQTETKDHHMLQKIWDRENLPESVKGFVGLAIIDFYLWPVVIRPWGKQKNLYKWPYYFSRSSRRVQGSEDLAANWAAEADRIIGKHGKNVAIICMEELDEELAKNTVRKMKHSRNTRIFSSSEFNASQMTEILRSLDLLVTSRYHAAVLSLEALIPQIAVGHDPRLRGFYKDLKMDGDYLIDYTYGKNTGPKIWNKLSRSVDELLKNPETTHEKLKKGFKEHLARSKENHIILKEFIQRRVKK